MTSTDLTEVQPPVAAGRPSPFSRTKSGYPRGLLLLAAVVAVAVLLPVVFLLWEAAHAGWGVVWPLIFRGLTWTLLLNTIQLALIVTACTAVIAVGAAWLIERTNLPLRR